MSQFYTEPINLKKVHHLINKSMTKKHKDLIYDLQKNRLSRISVEF